jgi:hypothetical protein
MAHVSEPIEAGVKRSEAGAIRECYVHPEGCGYRGKAEYARGFSLVWSGPAIKTFTASSDAPVKPDEPTLFEIWVCGGYWCEPYEEPVPGRPVTSLRGAPRAAPEHLRCGRRALPRTGQPRRSRPLVRRLTAEAGYAGQPSHPIYHGVGAPAHEEPFAHQAVEAPMREAMVFAEPGIYWEGDGGLRPEDNYLISADGAEKLCPWPDDFREL